LVDESFGPKIEWRRNFLVRYQRCVRRRRHHRIFPSLSKRRSALGGADYSRGRRGNNGNHRHRILPRAGILAADHRRYFGDHRSGFVAALISEFAVVAAVARSRAGVSDAGYSYASEQASAFCSIWMVECSIPKERCRCSQTSCRNASLPVAAGMTRCAVNATCVVLIAQM
jgi:hypothetical protein